MNGRERMDVTMRLGTPDRVPLMCQLSLGHYFLNAGLDAIEVWHDTDAFAEALVTLQQRYGFDGLLVNLPGRDPDWRRHVQGVGAGSDGERTIRWRNGWVTECPADDNPHVFRDGRRYHPGFEQVDPDGLYYVEPHDAAGLTWPQAWDFGASQPRPGDRDFFPPWHFDTLRRVSARVGPQVSIHSEVFSPFSQLLELLDYEPALLALMDDPDKVKACLQALCAGTVDLASRQVEAGAHAVLISSAFAGAGFLSPDHYREFVLPFERAVVTGLRARHDVPVYTHTCGAIGDRLELMLETGTCGIDTLDPPPLGTVELAEAKERTAGRAFLKGNLDPVHTLLGGDRASIRAAVSERIAQAGPGGGFILSSACSVPPRTPPANLMALREVATELGAYPLRFV